MDAEQLQAIAKKDQPKLTDAFHAMLKEWGYEDLTKDLVAKNITSFVDGEPEPDGIIAKFIYGWLNDGID